MIASSHIVIILLQVTIALGIFNVWVLRFGAPTPWRGGAARTMKEEFEVYGLPSWSLHVVGFAKLSLAGLLLVGIWVPTITRVAAAGLAVLMCGAIVMHIKVKDPFRKSAPALVMLGLCLVCALA